MDNDSESGFEFGGHWRFSETLQKKMKIPATAIFTHLEIFDRNSQVPRSKSGKQGIRSKKKRTKLNPNARYAVRKYQTKQKAVKS
jgi:hypothetical protein